MLEKFLAMFAMLVLDWITKRLEQPDTARTAARNNDLRDRIRGRVREYENRTRGPGNTGEGGP